MLMCTAISPKGENAYERIAMIGMKSTNYMHVYILLVIIVILSLS